MLDRYPQVVSRAVIHASKGYSFFKGHGINWRGESKLKEQSKSATMEPKIERRTFKRVKLINWPAKILIKDRSMDGATRNISPKGAFIYYFQPHGNDRPLKVHTVVDLIIEAPGIAPLFICAEVIWSNILSTDEKNTLIGVGLRFIEVTEKDRQFLQDFVKVYTDPMLNRTYWQLRSKK